MNDYSSSYIKLARDQFMKLRPRPRGTVHETRESPLPNATEVLISGSWITVDSEILPKVLESLWSCSSGRSTIRTVRYVTSDSISKKRVISSCNLSNLVKPSPRPRARMYHINNDPSDYRASNIGYGPRPRMQKVRAVIKPNQASLHHRHKWLYFTSNPDDHFKVIVTHGGFRKFVGNFRSEVKALRARNNYLRQIGVQVELYE